jgi:GTP-binding protein LepA
LKQVDETIGLVDTTRAVRASAKTGLGIDEVLEAVVKYVPPPKDADSEPLCLIWPPPCWGRTRF